jgi:hypothetical protein
LWDQSIRLFLIVNQASTKNLTGDFSVLVHTYFLLKTNLCRLEASCQYLSLIPATSCIVATHQPTASSIIQPDLSVFVSPDNSSGTGFSALYGRVSKSEITLSDSYGLSSVYPSFAIFFVASNIFFIFCVIGTLIVSPLMKMLSTGFFHPGLSPIWIYALFFISSLYQSLLSCQLILLQS